MAADEKDRFIQYLVDKVNTYELNKRAKARKLDQQVKLARKNKCLIFNTRNDRALQSQCKRKQKKARLFYVECNLNYEKCFKSDVCPKLNAYKLPAIRQQLLSDSTFRNL